MRRLILVVIYSLLFNQLFAGMPSFSGVLKKSAVFHLEAISFFGIIIVLLTFVLKKIWNSLSEEFPSLPKLTYKKSFFLIILVGTLFLVVLTMISGAREIMTPGVWEKAGALYEIRK